MVEVFLKKMGWKGIETENVRIALDFYDDIFEDRVLIGIEPKARR